MTTSDPQASQPIIGLQDIVMQSKGSLTIVSMTRFGEIMDINKVVGSSINANVLPLAQYSEYKINENGKIICIPPSPPQFDSSASYGHMPNLRRIFIGQKVLVPDTHDGLFYFGDLKKKLGDQRVLVEYLDAGGVSMTCETNITDIVLPLQGAVNAKVGDCVLAPFKPYSISYMPGIIIQNDESRNKDSVYVTVVFYNGRRSDVNACQAVPINMTRYEKIVATINYNRIHSTHQHDLPKNYPSEVEKQEEFGYMASRDSYKKDDESGIKLWKTTSSMYAPQHVRSRSVEEPRKLWKTDSALDELKTLWNAEDMVPDEPRQRKWKSSGKSFVEPEKIWKMSESFDKEQKSWKSSGSCDIEELKKLWKMHEDNADDFTFFSPEDVLKEETFSDLVIPVKPDNKKKARFSTKKSFPSKSGRRTSWRHPSRTLTSSSLPLHKRFDDILKVSSASSMKSFVAAPPKEQARQRKMAKNMGSNFQNGMVEFWRRQETKQNCQTNTKDAFVQTTKNVHPTQNVYMKRDDVINKESSLLKAYKEYTTRLEADNQACRRELTNQQNSRNSESFHQNKNEKVRNANVEMQRTPDPVSLWTQSKRNQDFQNGLRKTFIKVEPPRKKFPNKGVISSSAPGQIPLRRMQEARTDVHQTKRMLNKEFHEKYLPFQRRNIESLKRMETERSGKLADNDNMCKSVKHDRNTQVDRGQSRYYAERLRKLVEEENKIRVRDSLRRRQHLTRIHKCRNQEDLSQSQRRYNAIVGNDAKEYNIAIGLSNRAHWLP